MSQVTVECLQTDGRFRRQRANIETKWPNFVFNRRDKQAHSAPKRQPRGEAGGTLTPVPGRFLGACYLTYTTRRTKFGA